MAKHLRSSYHPLCFRIEKMLQVIDVRQPIACGHPTRTRQRPTGNTQSVGSSIWNPCNYFYMLPDRRVLGWQTFYKFLFWCCVISRLGGWLFLGERIGEGSKKFWAIMLCWFFKSFSFPFLLAALIGVFARVSIGQFLFGRFVWISQERARSGQYLPKECSPYNYCILRYYLL